MSYHDLKNRKIPSKDVSCERYNERVFHLVIADDIIIVMKYNAIQKKATCMHEIPTRLRPRLAYFLFCIT